MKLLSWWSSGDLLGAFVAFVLVAALVKLMVIEQYMPWHVPYDISKQEKALLKELDSLNSDKNLADRRADLAFELAQVYQNACQYDKALLWFRQALAQTPVHEHAQVAKLMTALGDLYRDWGKYEQSAAMYNAALIRHKALKESVATAYDLSDLALLFLTQARYSQDQRAREKTISQCGKLLTKAEDQLEAGTGKGKSAARLYVENLRNLMFIEDNDLAGLRQVLRQNSDVWRGG